MSLINVWLGLGSNINQQEHIISAIKALSKVITGLKASPVFESEPVGIKSDHFYNLVVKGQTSLSLEALSSLLKQIEADNGRYDKVSKTLPLDIDLLIYGDTVGQFGHITLPHDGILKNAYVLMPLAFLSPFDEHPVTKKNFAALWQESREEINQKLWVINTPWFPKL